MRIERRSEEETGGRMRWLEIRVEGMKARSIVAGEPAGKKWVGVEMIWEREYESAMDDSSRNRGEEEVEE